MTTAIERAVEALIGQVNRAMPDRLRAAYLEGSCADATNVPGSDIDITIILTGELSEDERVVLRRLADQEALDVEWLDEPALEGGLSPQLKHASRLLAGKDLRDQYPLISLELWTRERMKTSYWRLARLFNRKTPLSLPLDYPDPADEFFGYLSTSQRGTRDLVRATGWMATALIALLARQYVHRKRDCAPMYADLVGGEFSDLLTTIHTRCRDDWHYAIPLAQSDRLALREIARRVLGFENTFLAHFKSFVAQELKCGAAARLAEYRRLFAAVPIHDDDLNYLVSATAPPDHSTHA